MSSMYDAYQNDGVTIVKNRRVSKHVNKDINQKKSDRKRSKTPFELFCTCISVRGMAKLKSGPQFLRFSWLFFMICMTSLLLTSIVLLVRDFLNYDVNVHTQIKLDDKSPFPALTVCHHNPFSAKAYKIWESNASAYSPLNFNKQLANISGQYLDANMVSLFHATVFQGARNVYYQNLPYEKALEIGHDYKIFRNCMRYSNTGQMYFDDDCLKDFEHFKLTTFSEANFFNCHTFEPASAVSANDTNLLGLIVGLGPKISKSNSKQLFLIDVFEQATGLRVAVHEPGTLPNLQTDGLHIEPGKMNEINYQPFLREHLNTPTRPCFSHNQTEKFKDLYNEYNYTQAVCLDNAIQREIMNNCYCIYALYPRSQMPRPDLPYCGKLSDNMTMFIDRIKCLSKLLDPQIKRKYDKVCLPKCEYYAYESTVSITKWSAQHWQLYWLKKLNEAFNKLENAQPGNIKNSDGYKEYKEYSSAADWTKIPGERPDLDLEGDQFAYVVLKRKSQNTVVISDKLVLSMAVLLSRIGGLCSLTIGLTAAVVIELIEFFYLSHKSGYCGSKNNKFQRPMPQDADDLDGQMLFEKKGPSSNHCMSNVVIVKHTPNNSQDDEKNYAQPPCSVAKPASPNNDWQNDLLLEIATQRLESKINPF